MASDGGEQAREVAAHDPDALIRQAGTRGNPDHDQCFPVDGRAINRVPTYLLEEADRSYVLEINGGSGVLTDRLFSVADRMTVAEQDRTFAAHLRREFADEIESDRLAVVKGDALNVGLPESTACVSNLPYGISSEVSFCLLPRGESLMLMFRKEFGKRIVAEAGTSEYGRPSVNTQHYDEVELCGHVPCKAFGPKPAVQSVAIRITPREPEYEVDDEALFLDFVKALFTQRRKTIRNDIRNTAHISGSSDPEAIVEVADEGVLRKRVGNMAPAEPAELVQPTMSVGRQSMTLPVLAAMLFRLVSTTTSLQNGTVLDITSLFPTFGLRIAASAPMTVTIVVAWRLGARLHDKELGAVSMPVRHLSATVLRLVVVAGDGGFVFALWSLSGDTGTTSAQYDLDRETSVHIALSATFVVGVYVLTSVLNRSIGEIASTRPEVPDHQRKITYHTAQVTTCLTILAVVPGIWRADPGGLLVGAGLFSIVVGMVARQTLGLFIVGLIIMFSRLSEVGNWVEIGDHEGIVTEITIMNARIQTFDGEFVMIPNDAVSSEGLVSRSRKGQLRLDIEVGVDYDADIDHATEVVQAAVEDLDEALSIPKPQVAAKRLGNSTAVLGVRPWIGRPSARQWWRMCTAAISAVSEAFDGEGTAIPFPQRVLSEHDPLGPISLTDQRPEANPEADGDVEGDSE